MHVRALVGIVAVLSVTAGCAGGSSSHAALTATQAVHLARADGLTGVVATRRTGSWHCAGTAVEQGPTQPSGRYAGYKRPRYDIEFGDGRAPNFPQDTARIAMTVVVFDSAAVAAQCATAALYIAEHSPIAESTPDGPTMPFTVITQDTIEMVKHAPDAPGFEPGTTGEYETFLADGPAFALGLAYDAKDSRIVQADLNRVVSDIGG
ncbi:MAG TPA: hypothetical protein VGL44_01365 [Gaiellales bacterium]